MYGINYITNNKLNIYINYSIYNNQLNYSLSEYALGHANECCLIFTSCTSYDTNKQIPLTWNSYLCCDIINKDKKLRFKAEENMKVSEFRDRYFDNKKQDEEMYDILLTTKKKSFPESLCFIMDHKKYPDKESGKMSKLKKNYRTGKSLPDTIEKVMLICLALETGPKVSKHLIEKSIGGIPDVGNKKIAYETLLEHTYLPLDEWNRILENNFDLPPIKF